MPSVLPTRWWAISEPGPDAHKGIISAIGPVYKAGPGHQRPCHLTIQNPLGNIRLTRVGAQAMEGIEDGKDDFQPCEAGAARCAIDWAWFIGNPAIRYFTDRIEIEQDFFNESGDRSRSARLIALAEPGPPGGIRPTSVYIHKKDADAKTGLVLAGAALAILLLLLRR